MRPTNIFSEKISAKTNLSILLIIIVGIALVGTSIVLLMDRDEQDRPLTGELPGGKLSATSGDAIPEEPVVVNEPIAKTRQPLESSHETVYAGLLKERGVLFGFTRHPDGRPVSGAAVTILRQWTGSNVPKRDNETLFTAKSAGDGWFLFRGLPKGAYSLIARTHEMAGFASASINDDSPPARGMNREHDLVMRPCGSISGRVFGPGSNPLKAALIRPAEPFAKYALNSSNCLSQFRALSDESGSFLLDRLPQGRYGLVITAEGCAPRVLNNVLTGTRDLVVHLGVPGSISGRAIIAGKPAGGITITAEPENARKSVMVLGLTDDEIDDIIPLTAKTGKDGFYRLSPLGKGSYSIRAVSSAHSAVDSRIVGINPGQDLEGIDFVLQHHGSIAGRVTGSDTKQPLDGAWMMACRSEMSPSGADRWFAGTNEDGGYLFASLPGGNYVVGVVEAADHVNQFREGRRLIAVEPGEKTGGVDFCLEKGFSFHATVTTESGAHPSGVRFRMYSRSFDGFSNYSSIFNLPAEIAGEGDGRFRLNGIAPGDYRLSAFCRGWVSAGAEVKIVSGRETDDVEMVLEPAFDISGRVVDAEGNGVSGAHVSLTECSLPRDVVTTETGKFTLFDLEPIRGYLQVRATGFRTAFSEEIVFHQRTWKSRSWSLPRKEERSCPALWRMTKGDPWLALMWNACSGTKTVG